MSRRRGPRGTRLDHKTVPVASARCNEWLVDPHGVTPIGNTKALIDLACTRNIMHILKLYRVSCVLDVGANAGQYAQRLREAGWRGRIVSFEPVPRVFEELAHAAQGDPDWHVVNVALGREDSEATINVVSGQGFATSLLPASPFGVHRNHKLAATSPLVVQVRRLGPMMPELLAGLDDPRVYLKMDTQGYDLEAFAGAEAGLDLVVAMQSEISSVQLYEGMPDFCTALSTYRSHGFDLSGCWPVNYERDTYRAPEFDAILVRRPSSSASPGDHTHVQAPSLPLVSGSRDR